MTGVVLVTGGTRGLGLAVARRLAAPDIHMVLTYLLNHEAAHEAQAALSAYAGKVTVVQADARDPSALHAAVIAPLLSDGVPVRVLVNSAALGAFRNLTALSVRHWDLTLDTCLKGPWLLTTRLAPLLAGGAVVNVSSTGAVRTVPHYGAIGVAKAALEHLTRCLAAELAAQGVRVNAVRSGVLATSALDTHPEGRALRRETARRVPAGRLVTVEDVADAVAFLAGPASLMIRGQTLVVDGGLELLA